MKKIFSIFFIAVILYSCAGDNNKRPETAMDTGREFIRASLDGDFKRAEDLLLKDTQNIQLFESYKTYFERLPADKKTGYKGASYNINKYTDINDSTSVINYSNSYMHQPMEIKIVRANNIWSVDFKHTYAGNSPIE